MRAKYDPGTEITRVRQRLIDILSMLAARLEKQKLQGSRYYVGNQLSAVDIYSACFAAQVKPLPIEQCPTAPEMHAGYHGRTQPSSPPRARSSSSTATTCYQTYLELPMRF